MKKHRTQEITAGVCFLLATVSYMAGSGMVEGELAAIVSKPVPFTFTLAAGMLLELVNCAAVAVIGVMLYRRLKLQMQSVAFGYMLSRAAEAVLLAVGSFAGLLRASGALALHGRLLYTGMLILGLYSTIFCAALLKKAIGPRWLLITGAIGYAALAVYAVINLTGACVADPMWLLTPGTAFEIVFPVWLIVKGFPKQEA